MYTRNRIINVLHVIIGQLINYSKFVAQIGNAICTHGKVILVNSIVNTHTSHMCSMHDLDVEKHVVILLLYGPVDLLIQQ